MNKKNITAILLILGIIDGIYLTIVHFIPQALKCPVIGTVVNCDAVLTSAYSNIFGVPLAVIGLIWVAAALVLLFYGKDDVVRNVWLIFGLGGVLYSFSAQYLLEKICIYCLFLDLIIILVIYSFLHKEKIKKGEPIGDKGPNSWKY
jgi:uncharacterized membrane protein